MVRSGSLPFTRIGIGPKISFVGSKVPSAQTATIPTNDASPHANPIAVSGGDVFVANTPADTVDVIDSGVVTSTAQASADATGEITVVDYCVDLSDSLYPSLNGEVCDRRPSLFQFHPVRLKVPMPAISPPLLPGFNSIRCG